MILQRVQMLAVIVGGATLLIGCGAMPTSPSVVSPEPRLTTPPPLAFVSDDSSSTAAAGGAESFKVPFGPTTIGACNATAINASGVIHFVLTRNGVHYNFENFHGVDVFGNTYVFTAVSNIVATQNQNNGATTTTLVTMFNGLGQGRAPDFQFFGIAHVTTNAGGEPTAVFTADRIVCRG